MNDDRIEQVAKIIYEQSGDPEVWLWERATDLAKDRWRRIAQTLADAGLLAVREELGVAAHDQIATSIDRDLWERVAQGEHSDSARPVRRYVTEWVEVE